MAWSTWPAGAWIQALSLTHGVTLGKLFNLSVSQLPHPNIEDYISTSEQL